MGEKRFNSQQCVDPIVCQIFREPIASGTKTTCTKATTIETSAAKPSVNRELLFDSPSLVSSVMHGSRSRQRSRSPNARFTNTYDSEPILDTSPNTTIRRSYNYSSSSKKSVPSYNTDTIEVRSRDLPAELKDVPLSNDLLPGPGTKVTTTVSNMLNNFMEENSYPTIFTD